MIKGYNVYLRNLKKRDIPTLYKICNEKDVKIYNVIPDDIQSINKSLRKALSIINQENVIVGFITYKESSYYKGRYYIGITIGSKYWGRRYGQNSIKVLLRYLFGELNAIRVELEVVKLNLRAINCYKKCGFMEEGIKRNKVCIDGKYVDTIIMGILRKELADI